MTVVIEAILGYDILGKHNSIAPYYSTNSRHSRMIRLVSALKMMGFSSDEARNLRKEETGNLAYAVRQQWRKMAFLYHPDKYGYDEKMKQVNMAHTALVKRLIPKHRARTYDDAWNYIGGGYVSI